MTHAYCDKCIHKQDPSDRTVPPFAPSATELRRWNLAAQALDQLWPKFTEKIVFFCGFKQPKEIGLWADRFNWHSCFFENTHGYHIGNMADRFEPLVLNRGPPIWPGISPWRSNVDTDPIRLVLSLATAGYGGIHTAAWNEHYPSICERFLWISSSLFIAGSGFGVWMFYAVKAILRYTSLGYRGWIALFEWALPVYYAAMTLYAFARCFLVLEAFISLRDALVTVYDTPAWSQIIPHL
jgi:hypothetical protein